MSDVLSDLTIGMFDCDTHCYEKRDAFTKYMPKDLLDRSIFPVRLPDGSETVLADRRVAVFNSEQGLGFDLAYRPGSLKEMLKQMSSGNPDETYEPMPMRPEFQERAARMELLEEQGVDRCVLYPSTMALSVEQYVPDTPIAYANIHSFNRWFDETWDFDGDRISPTALLSFRDLDRSVAELEDILDRGARVVLFPTGPAHGRSPGDPYFDPIWARLEEANVVVAFHIMEHWYNEHIGPAWGLEPVPAPWHMSAWQWQNTYGERPIEDSLSALIFDNVFGRFPGLMVLASEFGASWVPHFVHHMDKSRGMGRNGPWIGGPLRERPSEIFRRHVRVAPYPEDDVVKIVEDLGHADSIVMGSDYPHAEGLATPADFAKLLSPLPPADQRKIMRDNAEALLGAR
ncbi:MAG TPA: amidohydrolase family protein [Acidimicrobiia bacterium]|jgi:predicted TIM-barrel fold metal-dependent hydrolase|nr:amidohydrolase family protein [Acidimicrobiia bacterium]